MSAVVVVCCCCCLLLFVVCCLVASPCFCCVVVGIVDVAVLVLSPGVDALLLMLLFIGRPVVVFSFIFSPSVHFLVLLVALFSSCCCYCWLFHVYLVFVVC